MRKMLFAACCVICLTTNGDAQLPTCQAGTNCRKLCPWDSTASASTRCPRGEKLELEYLHCDGLNLQENNILLPERPSYMQVQL